MRAKAANSNIELAKALIRAGITETLVIKAAAISEYQFRKLQREMQHAA